MRSGSDVNRFGLLFNAVFVSAVLKFRVLLPEDLKFS